MAAGVLTPLRRHLMDRMVLRPSQHPIEHPHQQRVVLTVDARPLECFVQTHRSDDTSARILVLKFPGTSGRGEQSTGLPLSLLPDVGGTTWTWNPPGYGASEGKASLTRIAGAALGFVNQVIEREADPDTTIWLAGNSIGCATALHVAATLELDAARTGLVLRNPPPIVDVVKHVAARYPLGRLIHRLAESLYEPMNAIMTAERVHLPAVFLQSGADTLVPPAMQRKIIDVFAGDKQVVVLDHLEHDQVATAEHEAKMREALHWLLQQTRNSLDRPEAN